MGWINDNAFLKGLSKFGRGVINVVGSPYYHYADKQGPDGESTGWAQGLKQISGNSQNLALTAILSAYGMKSGDWGGLAKSLGPRLGSMFMQGGGNGNAGGGDSGGLFQFDGGEQSSLLKMIIAQQQIADAARQSQEMLGGDTNLIDYMAKMQMQNSLRRNR